MSTSRPFRIACRCGCDESAHNHFLIRGACTCGCDRFRHATPLWERFLRAFADDRRAR